MKTVKKVTSRVNLHLPPELKDWYDATAQQLGMTTTAFMVATLTQAKRGTEKAKAYFIEHNVLPSLKDMMQDDEKELPDRQ